MRCEVNKISVVKLQKSYTDRKKHSIVVLHDFSLDVNSGEFLVVMGESGCGKSTLLRVLAGLEPYDFGEIYFDGLDASILTQKQKNMSYITQNFALYPHKTVYENIAEPLFTLRVPREERKDRIIKIAQLLHLEQLLARKPRELSGGQQQRVAIARSLVKEPSVCLFDEPLSALDPVFHDELITTIKSLHIKTSATFIYSTHNQIEAMRLGDRIALIHNRKVEQIGTPQEFVQHPNTLYCAKFLNSVFIFFAEAKCSKKTLEEINGNFKCDNPSFVNASKLKDHSVTIALRADDFSIDSQGNIEANVLNATDNSVTVEYLDQVFTLPIDEEEVYNMGDTIRLSIKPDNICIFDNGLNILD